MLFPITDGTVAVVSSLDAQVKVNVQGGEVIVREGRRYVEIREERTVVRMEKAPGQLVPLLLRTEIPGDAEEEAQYPISVAQRDEAGQVVGGASVIYLVE